MPTRKVTTFDGSTGEALEILRRLLARGVVSAATLAEAREAIRNDIRTLEERLARYKGLLEGAAAATVAAAAVPAIRRPRTAGRAGRAGVRTTEGTHPASVPNGRVTGRQLQGRYMSLIRQVPKNERVTFKSMIAISGKAATVDALQARVDALTKRPKR